MTVGDDVRASFGGSSADQSAAALLVANPATETGTRTGLILFPRTAALPSVWVGSVPAAGLTPDDAAALLGAVRPCSLLPEHGEGWFGRPGLSGHRLGQGAAEPAAGRDWSPLFGPTRFEQARSEHAPSEHGTHWARVEAADQTAGLELVTEIEAVPGGAIRARHTLTNTGRQPYVVDSLEVVFPLPGRVGEVLDFTGRQTAERIPQRHRIGDGLWLREGRRGHTGHDSATMVVAGVPGFAFGHGEVYGLHVAWSGNTVYRVERIPSGAGVTTTGGGELLLPGEITLAEGESYTTPWVYLAATRSGLDPARSTSTSGKPSTSATTSPSWQRWPTSPPTSGWNDTFSTTAGSPAVETTRPAWATGRSMRRSGPGD